ncbi:MAG: molybdopterin molybdenumtransferase MoeA, partial [Clostridia bacterium]|nr:molybdopterin molybdenumtransferase MoeA [Clostridia bacterium]
MLPTVDEALTRLLAAVERRLPPEEVPLEQAAGRLLAFPLEAPRALPPFD